MSIIKIKKNMKKLLLPLVLLLNLCSCSFDEPVKYKYKGVIVGKGYEPPTSGHKSNRDATYYVLLKEDSLGKVIRINVTIPAYYEIKEGYKIQFNLSNYDLWSYGNTTDRSKSLYEQ